MVNRKELNPDASPQAAYGARLRSVREARGWKQDELAERIGYSGRHISAVETGRKPPTRPFSKAVDIAFGLTGAAESFERAWGELRNGSLLEGFPEYLAQEARAAEIRLFDVGVIPGLLQTPEYARAIEEGHVKRGTLSPEQASERVEFLEERQAALMRRTPPMVIVVLDESCIRRPIGGGEVMKRQLDHLIKFADQPYTAIQLAPFTLGERRPFNRLVNLLTMPDRSVMAYVESETTGHLDREITSVLPLVRAYHQLQAVALSQAESVAMIEQVRKGTP
ncbi:helix-turn-helix domain-containing protein [Streptomyces noursei]|uniref:helix-turn-helix domain-containing protein n=1 Tax=Streptomyces noursei TaxID=1971 RepID=UPI001676B339|nr:helix-turn-helix transcriptional regulator [Streptomyces noursei]MCZ1017728.1 helix-turn-helix transcriptional regulator [Streptomyces noursei]GGX56731.1 transcriptional regulator [Streptomyces noursei]